MSSKKVKKSANIGAKAGIKAKESINKGENNRVENINAMAESSFKNIYIGLIFIFGLFFMLNLLTPLQGDDWGLRAISEGFSSIKLSYLYSNARFFELIYRGYIHLINPFVFDFINALFATVFIILSYVLIFGSFAKSGKGFFLILIFIFLLMIAIPFEDMFLWESGSVNYLWSFSCILLCLIPYRFFYTNHFKITNANLAKLDSAIFIAIFGILNLIAGSSNEIGALLALIAHFAMIVFAFIKKIKLPKWYVIGLVCFALGFLNLYFSPGQNNRALIEAQKYDIVSLSEILSMGFIGLIKRIYFTFNTFALKTPLILPLTLFCLMFFRIYSQISPKSVFLFIIYFIGFIFIMFIFPSLGLIALLFMQIIIYKKDKSPLNFTLLLCFCIWLFSSLMFIEFSKNLPNRVRIFDLVLLVGIITSYVNIFLNKIEFRSYYKKVLMVGGGSTIICFFIFTIYQYLDLRLKWNALIKYAENQKALQGSDIDLVYDRSKFEINYFMMSGWWKFNNRDEEKRNNSYAEALGVKSFEMK